MLSLLKSPWAMIAIIAAALGFTALVFFKGEQLGSAGTAEKLNSQTQQTISEIENAAEKARALRLGCALAGGVWDFAANRCQKAKPDQPRAGR